MTISKMTDRITVSFYEGITSDDIVLKALNKSIPPRMRSSKIKEWAYEYLKSNKELWEQIQKEINTTETVNIGKEVEEIGTSVKDKSVLKSMLNIVTAK
jgi:hypothetical protein